MLTFLATPRDFRLRKPSLMSSGGGVLSCLLMRLRFGFTFGPANVSARVAVTKETQKMDLALRDTAIQRPSTISPYGDVQMIANYPRG